MRYSSSLLFILAATLPSTPVVLADPLPPVFYSVGLEFPVQVFQQKLSTPGSLTGSYTGPYGSGTETASLITEPGTFSSASLNATGTGTGTLIFIGSESEVQYYFEVVGPPGTQVPVSIFDSGSASSSGAGLGVAEVIYNLPGMNGVVAGEACSDSFSSGCMGYGTSFSETTNLLLTPGEQVGLFVIAAAEGFDSPESSSASAQVDPYIFIDPSFADASQYSIEVSPGIGNSPPALPEPSTFVLLGTGILGLAEAARRKSYRA